MNLSKRYERDVSYAIGMTPSVEKHKLKREILLLKAEIAVLDAAVRHKVFLLHAPGYNRDNMFSLMKELSHIPFFTEGLIYVADLFGCEMTEEEVSQLITDLFHSYGV